MATLSCDVVDGKKIARGCLRTCCELMKAETTAPPLLIANNMRDVIQLDVFMVETSIERSARAYATVTVSE